LGWNWTAHPIEFENKYNNMQLNPRPKYMYFCIVH